MGDKIGAPRYYVEEMLGRSGSELKKEIEDGDKIICYYGYPSYEEGHLEYIYDSNEVLVSHKKLDEVISRRVKERIIKKLDIFVKIGADRIGVEEDIIDYMFLEPVDNEVFTEEGVAQKYGMKDKNGYEPFIIVYYDRFGRVVDRNLVEE